MNRKKLPWFGITRLERYYECRYCHEKTIKESWAIIFFKTIISIPFTTKVNTIRELEEGYYDKEK